MKRSAVTRDGPRRSTSPAYASADRQLPRVRAMGAPKRASGVAIRRSHAAAMRRPAPTAKPWMAAIDGLPDRRQTADAEVAVPLVREAVLRRECLELSDVGARDECLASRAAEHQHPDRLVGVDVPAGAGQALVHAPRERVPGRRPVEREDQDRAVPLDQDLVGRHPAAP